MAYGAKHLFLVIALSAGPSAIVAADLGALDPRDFVATTLQSAPGGPGAHSRGAPAARSVDRAAMETALGAHFGIVLSAADVAHMPISDPNSGGNLTVAMGTTGAQDDIGLYTGDIVRMVASNMDPHAVASVYSTADCSVNWPIHITDKATGDDPAKPWLNPAKSFNGDASNLVADARPNPNHLVPDIAHQPHFLGAAAQLALRTGDLPRFARYLKEMKAWASWNFFNEPKVSRGPTGGEGIIDPDASVNQPRGEAWGLVTLAQLYLLMCDAKALNVAFDDGGWMAWSKRALENNIHYLEHKYHLGDYDERYAAPYYAVPKGWAKNDLGILSFPGDVMSNGSIGYGKGADGKTVVIGGFMQAFQSWAVLWLQKIAPRLDLSNDGRAELTSLSAWAARWPVMLFGDADDPTAWPWQYAGTYTIAVGKWNADGSVAYRRNGGELFALTGQARPKHAAFLNHDATTVADQFGANFVANVWPSLVEAFDMGASGAAASVARARTSDQWRANPQFIPAFAYMVSGELFPGQGASSARTAPAPAAASAPEPKAVPKLPPAPTLQPTLSAAAFSPAPTPASATTTTVALRDYVGPPLTYFGIPQKMSAKDAIPPIYKAAGVNDITTPFTIWGGGAWSIDLRSMIFRSDGHATGQPNLQCAVAARFAADYSQIEAWTCTNAPPQVHTEEAGNAMGRESDGTTAAGHSYLGLQVQSVAEGGAPSLIAAFHAGSTQPNYIARLDLTKAAGGYEFFAGVTPEHPIVFDTGGKPAHAAGTYPVTSKSKDGIFVADAWNPVDNDVLVKWDGTRELHPQLAGNYQSPFELVDHLHNQRIAIAGGSPSYGAKMHIAIEDLATRKVYAVGVVGDVAQLLLPNNGQGIPAYMPERCGWVHAERYDRFVGYFEDSPDGLPKLIELTPSANRLVDAWTIKVRPITRKDGDTVAPPKPPSTPNHVWSRGFWIDPLDSYVVVPTAATMIGIRPSFATR